MLAALIIAGVIIVVLTGIIWAQDQHMADGEAERTCLSAENKLLRRMTREQNELIARQNQELAVAAHVLKRTGDRL